MTLSPTNRAFLEVQSIFTSSVWDKQVGCYWPHFLTRKLKCRELGPNLPEWETQDQIQMYIPSPQHPVTCFFPKMSWKTFISFLLLSAMRPHSYEGDEKYKGMNWGFIFFGPQSLDSILHSKNRTELPVQLCNSRFLTGLNPVNTPT